MEIAGIDSIKKRPHIEIARLRKEAYFFKGESAKFNNKRAICPCYPYLVRIGGILVGVLAELAFNSPYPCFFFKNYKSMSTYNYAPGAVHLDFHHNNISMSASSITDLVRSFISDRAEDITPSEDSSFASDCQSDFPLFKYIHVAVTDDKEREQIHKMVYNIVRLPKMKQICDELYQLIKKEKILSTIKPEAMLAELRRVGMPSADIPGFSDQNFYSNYRA